MRGLYAIVDSQAVDARGLDPVAVAQALLSAGPCAVQLRAKLLSARDTLALLEALVPLCRAAGVPLYANDRPDLAQLAGTDGVHVGQDDLPVAEVRRFDPQLSVGVSTHDLLQLREALEGKPDYVAFGPVYGTRSKANPDRVVGVEGLAAAAVICREAEVPLVAIGGIDVERAVEIALHADAGAVISALVDSGLEHIASRARLLRQALEAG